MSSLSSYTPFLIGKFTSGQFQYLQSWQGPIEAFQPFVNAYSYRGSIYKRDGYVPLGHTGLLRYIDNISVATGNGTATYSGTIANHPIVAGSVTLTALTAGGLKTCTDDGAGTFVGTLAGANSLINYTTGVWNLNSTSNIANPKPIMAKYTYTPGLLGTSAATPIMGINVWINEANNSDTMTVQDQKRMAVYNATTKLFDPVSTFSQVNFQTVVADGTGPFTITTGFTNLAPYSVTLSNGTSTIQDDGIGGFLHNGNALPDATNFANTTTINYTTGVITLNLVAGAAASYTVTGSLQGDYFTGGNTNFFNFTNWKPNDTLSGLLYLTNNKDRITTFDGTNLARPPFIIRDFDIIPHTNGIVTTSDVKVYKNRLLLLRPTVNIFSSPTSSTVSGTVIEAQVIRYSSQFYTFGVNTIIPFDFVADVTGHGGTSEAPTADWIIAGEFLRDAIVMFLQKSTWLFRFTGSAFDPFTWQQINSSRTSNAVYGSLAYDNNATSMGTKGLISCDGTNVDRYDIAVIDQFTDIDNDNFIQCIARRDDIRNQSWMIYPSKERGTANDFSDKAIIYNFLENAFATYKINLSTIGLATTFEDITWSSFAPGSGSWVAGKTWVECNFTWNNALSQNLAPEVYGGDQNGYVYTLNVTETDNGTHIDTNLTSNRWNPFIQDGQRCRFGYIDIYYQINPDVTLVVEIFVNNSTAPNLVKHLVMDGPEDNDFAWKRIQVNMQGEFIRMNITTPVLNAGLENEDQNNGSFLISGIILWAQPAGRLVPGGFS